MDQGLLIFEDSRSHSDTSHSVGFLWASDQLIVEICTLQHTTLTIDIHPRNGGIQTHNTSKRAAADSRLRPRDNWNRRSGSLVTITLPKRPGLVSRQEVGVLHIHSVQTDCGCFNRSHYCRVTCGSFLGNKAFRASGSSPNPTHCREKINGTLRVLHFPLNLHEVANK